MRTRFNPSGCCCDEAGIEIIAHPESLYEPPIPVFTNLEPEAIDRGISGGDGNRYAIANRFSGYGHFLYISRLVPPTVSNLFLEFRSWGWAPDATTTPSWVDVEIDIVLVPRDYVVIAPAPAYGIGIQSYAWDIPQAIPMPPWTVSGAWIPTQTIRTPDLAGAYNSIMSLPAGPVPINLSQAGRVFAYFSSAIPASYTVNQYMRQMYSVSSFDFVNIYRSVYQV